MKSSVYGILSSLALFTLTNVAYAGPVDASKDLIKRSECVCATSTATTESSSTYGSSVSSSESASVSGSSSSSSYEELDVIISSLYTSVKTINAQYNSTCAKTCTATTLHSWLTEVGTACQTSVTKCNKLPSGYLSANKEKCAKLALSLLLELQYTMKFLLNKCGLLNLLAHITSLTTLLTSHLTTCFSLFSKHCTGFKTLVSGNFESAVGSYGCLLCNCGFSFSASVSV